MAQQGYAVVDVDEDPSGPSHGSGLEFQNARHPNAPSPPDVPFSPFNLTYYQTYFDVDTNTVLKRVGMAMIPRPGFITEVCDGQIDMYGSFWTLTTLILTLYTSSTLTTSIAQYMNSSHASSNLPLLSTATSAIYVYGLLVPSLFWGATKWLDVGEWGIAEALGIYGYAMSIFIPLSLLCLIPVGILRWVLIGLGGISSGYFLPEYKSSSGIKNSTKFIPHYDGPYTIVKAFPHQSLYELNLPAHANDPACHHVSLLKPYVVSGHYHSSSPPLQPQVLAPPHPQVLKVLDIHTWKNIDEVRV
ncbi:hypothetical protein D1P53_000834 [Cryptococcus gattii VGV]|nr:hypothetical protein D1P53_000834 [Cryptococcus gattii VGV]